MENDHVPYEANPIRRPPWNKSKLIGPQAAAATKPRLVDTDEATDG